MRQLFLNVIVSATESHNSTDNIIK